MKKKDSGTFFFSESPGKMRLFSGDWDLFLVSLVIAGTFWGAIYCQDAKWIAKHWFLPHSEELSMKYSFCHFIESYAHELPTFLRKMRISADAFSSKTHWSEMRKTLMRLNSKFIIFNRRFFNVPKSTAVLL